ncbi:MAG: hypothetical protein AMXMBFR57_31760 [Acidimicrobiia bacterium]|jgi:VWFA-related protein
MPRVDAQAQAPTFRAAAEGVTVEVSVQAGNRPVTGLRLSDFTLHDNGVPQTIVDLTYATVPIDVTVVLDISFSVSGALLDRLQRAVAQLVRDLPPHDRLRLLMFNARVAEVVDYTTDSTTIERAIKSAQAGGGTALHDAISLALVSARAPGRRQLVVVFTDGSDASSISGLSDLHRVAERTTATLAMVMPGARGATGRLFGVPPALVELVESTAGTIVPFRSGEDLETVFRRILDGFRATYVLHFTPTGVERHGFHELRVGVSRSNATVTSRRGYFAR